MKTEGIISDTHISQLLQLWLSREKRKQGIAEWVACGAGWRGMLVRLVTCEKRTGVRRVVGYSTKFYKGGGGRGPPWERSNPLPFHMPFLPEKQGLKKLEFQLVLWARSSHISLAQSHFLLGSVKDFIRLLLIGQVSFKSYLPSKKIHLSRITGWEFFRAQQKVPLLYTLYSQMVPLSHLD